MGGNSHFLQGREVKVRMVLEINTCTDLEEVMQVSSSPFLL